MKCGAPPCDHTLFQSDSTSMVSTHPHVSKAFHWIECMWAVLNERGQLWHKCLDVKVNKWRCCLCNRLVDTDYWWLLQVLMSTRYCRAVTCWKINVLLLTSTFHFHFSLPPLFKKHQHTFQLIKVKCVFKGSWETTNEAVSLSIQLYHLYLLSSNTFSPLISLTERINV